MKKELIIRCRALIVENDKLLVVKHTSESDFYALPGGHLEWGEDIEECMSRELEEELGVKGEVGRLLYINNFTDGSTQSVEFFFEIKNAKDYLDINRPVGSHADELHEIRWVGKNENIKILPSYLNDKFREDNLQSDDVRFIRL